MPNFAITQAILPWQPILEANWQNWPVHICHTGVPKWIRILEH